MTHVAVLLEVCNMPSDALGDFLEQLVFGHWTVRRLAVFGGHLSMHSLAMRRCPLIFALLYTPALILWLAF